MCTNLEPIADITYEFYGGATDVILEWTGDTLTGVNGNIIPGTNQFVVSGILRLISHLQPITLLKLKQMAVHVHQRWF